MPRLARLAFIVLISAYLSIPYTKAQGISLVSEIQVDVVSADATQARTEAMAQAEREGLVQLLDKLAPAEKDTIIKTIEPKQISSMVKATEVVEEKVGDKSYRALLRISYDAEALTQLIEKKIDTMGGDEDTRTSTLVVPVYQPDEKTTLLWEASNLWLKAWDRVGLEMGTGTLIVPYGDNIDGDSLASETALSAHYETFLPLIRRYGVRDVSVLQARLIDNASTLEVVKRSLDRKNNEVTLFSYRADPQESLDALTLRAAHDIADQIMQLHKAKKNAKPTGEEEKVGQQKIIAGFTTMQNWNELRKKLENIPSIRKVDIIAMAPQQVDLMVSYRGTSDSLAQAILTRGIAIKQSSQYWSIGE